MPVSHSDVIDEGGNLFQGFAAKVSDMLDVRRSIDALIQKPGLANATHIAYAYAFSDHSQGRTENFQSDGDYGLGLELLRIIQKKNYDNCILMVTRHCSPEYRHIGKRRFEIATSVCNAAYDAL